MDVQAPRVDQTGSSPHAHESAGRTPESLALQRKLLVDGEASLVAGRIDDARRAFEQAALMAHEAEIELGLLRTQMQAGEYRQALGFAAHTAGVHLDEVDGRVFYAWLLNLGGQMAMAERTLAQAEERAPAHPMVRAVRQRFQSGSLLASDALLTLPARLAPFETGRAVGPRAQVLASAYLLADGRHALAPHVALTGQGRIWLRNGLGQTAEARVDERDEALGLTLLTLSDAMPPAGGDLQAPQDAFAGSPAFACDYPADPQARPAWPVMRAGFLGMPQRGLDGVRYLGVELPGRSRRGGPVFDQGGRLVGLVVGADGAASGQAAVAPERMINVSVLLQRFGDKLGGKGGMGRPSPMGADEIYERAMRTCLQVIVDEPERAASRP
ncbi:MAG TPA: hypothetical protein VFW93_00755 [Aquabacterium sp.]|uniref:hypothetical protein n=1 Tax=Aquabacterium sp. TaxID=1872578 RepID=UPI002E382405|nr:hypothetical protein [Aquabacterium sp.]HEX5354714.1 hypothetical protein [Aquabacterium sp.]